MDVFSTTADIVDCMSPPKRLLNNKMNDPWMGVAVSSEFISREEVCPDMCSYLRSSSSIINGIFDSGDQESTDSSDSDYETSSRPDSPAADDFERTCSPVFPSSPENLTRAPYVLWKTARNQGLLSCRRSLIPVPVDTVHFFDVMDVKPEVYMAPEVNGDPRVYLGYFADTDSLYMIERNCLANLTSELRKVKAEFEQQKRTILMAQKRKMEEDELIEYAPMMKQGRFEEEHQLETIVKEEPIDEEDEGEEPQVVIKEEPIW